MRPTNPLCRASNVEEQTMKQFEMKIQKELSLMKAHADNKDRHQLDAECADTELSLISEELN